MFKHKSIRLLEKELATNHDLSKINKSSKQEAPVICARLRLHFRFSVIDIIWLLILTRMGRLSSDMRNSVEVRGRVPFLSGRAFSRLQICENIFEVYILPRRNSIHRERLQSA